MFVRRDEVTQPYIAAVNQKEPSKINSNFSKEGSRHIPVDMEHYKIRAKTTTNFSIVSIKANCQQHLSSASRMLQVVFKSALKTVQF